MYRVSFYFGEAMGPDGVPDDLVVPIGPFRVAMLGTEKAPRRCIALQGTIGECVSCSIHDRRSSPCREFPVSWQDGVHNPDCDRARAAFGLPPVTPDDGPRWHEGPAPEWPEGPVPPGLLPQSPPPRAAAR